MTAYFKGWFCIVLPGQTIKILNFLVPLLMNDPVFWGWACGIQQLRLKEKNMKSNEMFLIIFSNLNDSMILGSELQFSAKWKREPSEKCKAAKPGDSLRKYQRKLLMGWSTDDRLIICSALLDLLNISRSRLFYSNWSIPFVTVVAIKIATKPL